MSPAQVALDAVDTYVSAGSQALDDGRGKDARRLLDLALRTLRDVSTWDLPEGAIRVRIDWINETINGAA